MRLIIRVFQSTEQDLSRHFEILWCPDSYVRTPQAWIRPGWNLVMFLRFSRSSNVVVRLAPGLAKYFGLKLFLNGVFRSGGSFTRYHTFIFSQLLFVLLSYKSLGWLIACAPVAVLLDPARWFSHPDPYPVDYGNFDDFSSFLFHWKRT